MSSSASRRQQVVSDALSRVHKILASEAVTRQSLDTILDEVKQLATQSSLWNESDFPPPKPDEYQARYLIDQGDDLTVALYLNVMRPGKFAPPMTIQPGPVSQALRVMNTTHCMNDWMMAVNREKPR